MHWFASFIDGKLRYGKTVSCSKVAARLHRSSWSEMKWTMIISTIKNLYSQVFGKSLSQL
ncbi:hypothetical protein PRIPAC_91086 [Pristionchus pacificus]|uniref:Uncharacterized protein n=1 Tax=Pristionchus pacificus TaxID=54126 RepID=A0A2A6CX42_PRIPA|nr:hypothetical protein PRIPAC_91086 [Pristionchus pacificus]|eukprot:PDM82729.1 hypothetical protein PRIPAC_37122 [Pristionchus pacificus]